jgi:hypothetical protein
LSLRLERSGGALFGATLLVTLLAAAMLVLFPAAAGAQTRGEGAPSVVVGPGDSLWSISAGRLGPDATPRRVMKGAQRIHALNRARVGADPDLIFVGQVLRLPRAMSGPPNGATVPAREAASAVEAPGSGASGYDPKDRAAKGPAAGKDAPKEAPGRGAVPRSEISVEEAARMLGADTKVKENLPAPRATAPVPAVRTVASKDAQPGALFGFMSDTSAGDRRQLLGLGVWALALVLATLVVTLGRGAPRRGIRKRDLGFRGSYGGPYAASELLAYPEDAPRRVPEARGGTAYSDGPTNEGTVSEDRLHLTDPFVLARAKRARVRRQSSRPRPRGLRRPARKGAQRRPASARRGATARTIREEWQPRAALVDALKGMPLCPRTSPGGNLAGLKPLIEGALEELRRMEQLRGLSRREKTRRGALMALMAAVERDE